MIAPPPPPVSADPPPAAASDDAPTMAHLDREAYVAAMDRVDLDEAQRIFEAANACASPVLQAVYRRDMPDVRRHLLEDPTSALSRSSR